MCTLTLKMNSSLFAMVLDPAVSTNTPLVFPCLIPSGFPVVSERDHVTGRYPTQTAPLGYTWGNSR